MKLLKEVIVAEGKQDIVAIKKAIEAEVIITGGFALNKRTMEKIQIAYEKRGIIILTDPDGAGERIRKYLAERFPAAKHAFVPRLQACKNNDIGVEQASPEAIRTALSKVRTQNMSAQQEFSQHDLLNNSLVGTAQASAKRDRLGELLGIGYANAKQFVYRLNNYGVTRWEFEQALLTLNKEE